jgi:hypothetical protein
VMRGVGFAPEIALSLMAKKLNFTLIWPEYLLPYVWGVTHMPFIVYLFTFIYTGLRLVTLMKWSSAGNSGATFPVVVFMRQFHHSASWFLRLHLKKLSSSWNFTDWLTFMS